MYIIYYIYAYRCTEVDTFYRGATSIYDLSSKNVRMPTFILPTSELAAARGIRSIM